MASAVKRLDILASCGSAAATKSVNSFSLLFISAGITEQ